jgi:hypothetical protein
MVEPSQQQLTGMVVATARKGWKQSHAGIQLLPSFRGGAGGDRSLLWPFVASPTLDGRLVACEWLGRIRRIEILDWRIQPIDIANFAFVCQPAR